MDVCSGQGGFSLPLTESFINPSSSLFIVFESTKETNDGTLFVWEIIIFPKDSDPSPEPKILKLFVFELRSDLSDEYKRLKGSFLILSTPS